MKDLTKVVLAVSVVALVIIGSNMNEYGIESKPIQTSQTPQEHKILFDTALAKGTAYIKNYKDVSNYDSIQMEHAGIICKALIRNDVPKNAYNYAIRVHVQLWNRVSGEHLDLNDVKSHMTCL